jgi:hypothetical protein
MYVGLTIGWQVKKTIQTVKKGALWHHYAVYGEKSYSHKTLFPFVALLRHYIEILLCQLHSFEFRDTLLLVLCQNFTHL